MTTKIKSKPKSKAKPAAVAVKPKSVVVPDDELPKLWRSLWNGPEDHWKPIFLETFKKHQNFGKAVVVSGVSRSKVSHARRTDRVFDEVVTDLWEDAIDNLEASALKRATEGHMKYTYDKDGNLVNQERKYETQLTIFMLQANRKKYQIRVDDKTSLEDVVNRFHEISSRLRGTIPERQSSPSMN